VPAVNAFSLVCPFGPFYDLSLSFGTTGWWVLDHCPRCPQASASPVWQKACDTVHRRRLCKDGRQERRQHRFNVTSYYSNSSDNADVCSTQRVQRGGTDKNHLGQNLPDKIPPDKTLGQNPREQLRDNLNRGLCPGFLYQAYQKSEGSEMCDVLFGCPGMCDKVWQEGGQNWLKIAWRNLWTAP